MPDHRRARPVDARARLAALAALLGIWLMPLAAHAERVGVVVATTVNTHRGEAERLADALGQALIEQLDIDVVAGSEAARRLPPGGVPDTCVVDSTCQRDIAGRLAADQLLILAVVRVGARVQIDTTWVQVTTGRTASRARIMIHDKGKSARKVFAAAASDLLPDAELRIGASRGEPAAGDAPAGPDAASVALSQPAPSRRLTAGVWVAGGISASALLAGSVFAIDAVRRHRDLETRGCLLMACPEADLDAVDTRTRLADALFGVGLVAGVTAGVLYWRSSQTEPAPTAGPGANLHMDVTATRHGLAITWGGHF
ncbi:MAG TPA: hypothetical protein VNM90_27555 [Haliangium sp.]|nr:hypothetical protein [Haliangium sp.]